ncbi:YwhD family protein [Caldalkalibacillus salinus]|uniref:YwhD family protein n=1 Tax=Caldalkalibacillus salinus TaxID=2803787 RepID=UPI00192248F9|nr:YwhD family protein [Caldalkalibacillus salinus]
MFNNNSQKGNKKNNQFTIVSSDSTGGHGGFGVGTLNLNNLSPVIVDVEDKEAYVDLGALHAKSAIEKRIKFLPNKDDVPNGRPYWLVWVAIDNGPEGPYYAGITACEMSVDTEIRRGYKNLPEHVNKMDKALKRYIMVEHMDESSKKVLGEFLKSHDENMWAHSTNELKEALISE